MNWGWKISIVYILFATGILTLVYKATQEDYPLVTTDYYAKEKAQQGKIDAAKQVVKDKAQIKWLYYHQIPYVVFPNNLASVKKIIEVYCAFDPKRDQTIETLEDSIAMPLEKGKYQIKSTWEFKGKKYYQEKEVIIR
jgi:hypothetical protein